MSHAPASKTDKGLDDYEAGWKAAMRLLREGRSWSGHERKCSFLNLGLPRFANVSAATGLDFADDGRGLALVDWDHDGDLDIWMRNRTGPRLRLMLNESPSGADFLQLKLRGTTSNRDAIGARVEVELEAPSPGKLIQGVYAGDGFLSQSSKWLHFGLGSGHVIRQVSVRWPGGVAERFAGIEPGRRYVLVQGSGRAAEWSPPRKPLKLSPATLPPTQPTGAARVVLSRRFPRLALRATAFDDPRPRVVGAPGHPMLINLWASWCAPCIGELKDLAEHERELRAAGLSVLALTVEGIDEDKGTTPEDARRLLGEIKFPFDAGIATTELLDKLQLLQAFLFDPVPSFTVPQSLLFDEQGRLALIYRGPVTAKGLLGDLSVLAASGNVLRDGSLPFPGRWYSPYYPPESYARSLANRFQDRYPEEVVGLIEAAMEHRAAQQQAKPGEPREAQEADDHLRLATGLVALGRIDEAISHFRRSLTQRPASSAALRGLGLALAAQGKPEEAMAQFRRAIEVDPDDSEAHNNLALALHLQGRPDEAIRHYRQALRIKPDSDQVHYNLGMALTMSGSPGEALAELREALRLNPDSLGSLTDLAWLLATAPDAGLRKPDEALRLAQRAAELSRNQDPTILDTLAAAYAAASQFDQAVTTAQAALTLANRTDDRELMTFIRQRLDLYRQGQPYRESPVEQKQR